MIAAGTMFGLLPMLAEFFQYGYIPDLIRALPMEILGMSLVVIGMAIHWIKVLT